jgi:MFS family permease
VDRRRLAVAGLHAGGFLGPFGGGLTASILPELGSDFDVSAAVASATITAYLVPFAVVMLFSGTWGARWGVRRSVLTAYVVYVGSSLLCVVAPTFEVLLVGRAVQGVANAFTTPLLLATIAAITPRERLGRALGLFGSLQAAGQTSGPLFGGLSAEADWRLVFVGAAVAAMALAVIGLPPAPPAERTTESRPSLRSAWRPEVLRASAVAMVGWGCLGGISFLVAFRVADSFGLGAGERGVLLTGFGVVGILTARLVGHWVERVGGRRSALLGSVVAAVPVALIGLLPSVVAVAVAWAVAGLCAQLVLVGLNALILTEDGDNRAGSISVVQAFRFVGAAAAPLALTPVYHLDAAAGFLLPAALLAITPLALARRPAQ